MSTRSRSRVPRGEEPTQNNCSSSSVASSKLPQRKEVRWSEIEERGEIFYWTMAWGGQREGGAPSRTEVGRVYACVHDTRKMMQSCLKGKTIGIASVMTRQDVAP